MGILWKHQHFTKSYLQFIHLLSVFSLFPFWFCFLFLLSIIRLNYVTWNLFWGLLNSLKTIYLYICFIWYIKNLCIVLTSNSIFLFLFALVSIMDSSWISLVEELFFLLGGIISCFDDLFLAISICICCGGKKFDFTKRPHEYATTCGTLVRNMKAQTSYQWQSKLNTLHHSTGFPHSVKQLNNIYIFKNSL